mmetsp:Transcript_99105/g.284779  ORF Transcript_99105/g.284779 Transcript_99105/m.284779 type:complete len:224 (-) Transcript_99105:1772-2443(-)
MKRLPEVSIGPSMPRCDGASQNPHAVHLIYTPSSAYNRSMIAWYVVSTTLRFSFLVGVSSPPSSEKFVGKMVNFWILKALFGQHLPSLFAAVMAAVTASIQALSWMAAEIVLTAGLTRRAPASNWSVPGDSPFAPTAFKVTSATLYFRLSPIIMTSAMPSQAFFTASSTGTGAMFSPPSPMMISLKRPVIFVIPCSVINALSPECSQPSLSIDSAHFFAISAW